MHALLNNMWLRYSYFCSLHAGWMLQFAPSIHYCVFEMIHTDGYLDDGLFLFSLCASLRILHSLFINEHLWMDLFLLSLGKCALELKLSHTSVS